ncbi:site-specific integrase [Psychrobacillus sp. Sa2BUA9]|uniref:Site-specific integrase n=1 Tax=Psychrobacillus faecigallinarum TaxID=2762235 RepID=A0ABR8RBU2_9BACI|nr:site-specific integrase [Psychrobacillus faecigallinarum]MBD7945271.1 site-specific integrase [Psychrobacillus faecigallinarum]
MTTIKKYTKKDGATAYMFNVYLGTDPLTGKPKRTTRRGFTSLKEAKLALARLELNIETNGFKMSKKMLFREVYELWLENYRHTVKLSTVNTTVTYFKTAILPKFANLPTDKITIAYCQKIVNEWSKHYVNYRSYRNYVKMVLDYATTLQVITDNPMQKIIMPKPVQKIVDTDPVENFYNMQQLEEFLSTIEKNEKMKVYVLFRLLAFTGARKGEVLALTWDDINFIEKTIRFNKTLAKTEESTRYVQTPKTAQSKRTISVDDKTLDVLEKWKKTQAKLLLTYGINTTFNNNQPVLASTDKRAMNDYHSTVYPNHQLKALIKKYGFPPITIHGFRHTHASLLFEAGASLKDVQDRIGHTDIKTTMNVYTHVTQKMKDNTAEKFAKYVNF